MLGLENRDKTLIFISRHFDQTMAILIERSFGKPMCLLRYTIRNKTGNQNKILFQNKAIPSGAREPAALWIYAPLRRFHFDFAFLHFGGLKKNTDDFFLWVW